MVKHLISKRKEPAQDRARQTVESILDATAQLLDGDESVSTNRIAERAGVSIGSLYQYFPNATAIFAAIAERERARVSDAIKSALATLDPSEPEPAIRAAIRALLDAFGKRQRVRRKILLALMPVVGRETQERFFEAAIDEIAEAARSSKDGPFRPLSRMATLVLGSAVMGAVRMAVMSGSTDLTDPEFEDELVLLAMGFLAARRVPPVFDT
ncbi:TetR/AcrR family transcriptional regulator [Aquibium sp. LZ166]|uniref:TetR/AcrR family transcriptional regulator n=1 Tax=Aquibium pacificus TaxID=3153579 RepID=A0ABV3SMN7_9HYPH